MRNGGQYSRTTTGGRWALVELSEGGDASGGIRVVMAVRQSFIVDPEDGCRA